MGNNGWSPAVRVGDRLENGMNIFILFYWWDIYIIFNMCCQSKKKPVATTAVNQPGPVAVNNGVQPLFPATVGYPATTTNPATNYQYTNSVLSSGVGQSRIPKSTISFSAQDYDSTPLNNQAAFVATKKVTHIVHDRGDRMEDYATEVNTAEKSKMILDNKILKYSLLLSQLWPGRRERSVPHPSDQHLPLRISAKPCFPPLQCAGQSPQ